MPSPYRALEYRSIDRSAHLKRPDPGRYDRVVEDDPAIRVMTDFNIVTPFSIAPSATLDDINRKMIDCAVRLLFVIEADGTLRGLVTSTDVLDEKPILYVNEHGGDRGEIMAKDIMTARENLMALDMRDIESASVGDMVRTMASFARQHILVVEAANGGAGEVIRGMFSTTRIAGQLDIDIPSSSRASTFAELERAIGTD